MLRDALVVGISSYQNLPHLNAPAHDAEAIAYQLESQGDFRVTRLPEIVQSEKLRVGVKTPVSLADLESALVKLFKPKGSNVPHTALFYFSGHGLQKEAGIREGYLATSDTNPNAHFYGLSLFWLRRLLQESPVRQRIVLLDCCNSGEILNFLEADPGAKSGTDRLFMAAAREYESAYESLTSQYSVFTQALLEGLDPRRLTNGVVTNYALTDWVSNALKGESQQPLFENSGSEIVLTRCQNPLTVLQTVQVHDICPYRGLEAFEEGHAEYFFGRENLTDQLIDRLRTKNFLAVVGASGSGKSSLVQAGLVYRLRRGQTLAGSNLWQIRVMTPTEQPFRSLANAFVSPDLPALDRADQLQRAERFLQDGTTGLSQLVRASLLSQDKRARMVLVIDQFEEVFTLCQDSHAECTRHRFFNSLLLALQEHGDRFNLVVTVRADFLSKCSFYKSLIEQIENNLIMVTPLSYDQIKASILKPAEKVGLVCEPNLVYNILLDIVGAPGELPLLQYTLLELWHKRQKDPNSGPPRLTLDAYTELGGVRGTLQKRADEVFYSLSPEEQLVAKRIFIALTHLGEGTEDTRRRVVKSELFSPQFPFQLVEGVLEKLVNAKLVIKNQIAPISKHQEQIDQRFANVSTALRLAQVMRSKTNHLPQFQELEHSLPQNQSDLPSRYTLNVARITKLSDVNVVSSPLNAATQETVDIAHEALIRNWPLLRSWLDDNREILQRQRRIERAATRWNTAEPPRSPDYLLRGSRLLDAEDYLIHFPNYLSALAQQFIAVSLDERCRTRRELRMLQVLIPCTLMVALGITFLQYQVARKNEVEKDYQLRVATSRQWSAIAQSILQEPNGDPSAALLVSRLAAERGHTFEAESSLRSALQELRLQTSFQLNEGSAQEVAFSPNLQQLAVLSSTGQIQLWSLTDQKIENVLSWDEADAQKPANQVHSRETLKYTPDGQYLIAATERSTNITVWKPKSGQLLFRLGKFPNGMKHLAVSLDGQFIAASDGGNVTVWHLASGQVRARFSQSSDVKGLAFTGDSSHLLLAAGNGTTVWRVADRQRVQVLLQKAQVIALQVSPDSRWVAIADRAGTLQVWNLTTGKQHQEVQLFLQRPAERSDLMNPRVLFSPDGQSIAVVHEDGQVGVLQIETGQKWRIDPLEASAKASENRWKAAISFSPDGRQLVVSEHRLSHLYTATIREVATGRELNKLRGHTNLINSIQFSQDGLLVATASADSSIRLWMAKPGGELPTLQLVNKPFSWATFQGSELPSGSPMFSDSTHPTEANPGALTHPKLWTVTSNGIFNYWNVTSPQTEPLYIQNTEYAAVESPPLQFFDQLKRLGHTIWPFKDTESPSLEARSPSEPSSAPNFDPAKVESELAVKAAQPMSKVVNLSTQVPAGTQLTGATMSQNGTLFAIANTSGTVEIWQVQQNQAVARLQTLQLSVPEHSQAEPSFESARITVTRLAFSRDNQKLLGVGTDKIIRLWDVASGKLLHQLSGHESLVEQARFSPDDKQIISASWDRTARIWEVETGQMVKSLTHTDVITSAKFSPNSQQVLITSLDSTARLFDLATETTKVILAGHRGAVLDGDFSPDGQLLVTASTDGTARLWDATTGTERAILRPGNGGNQESIKQSFFSPNGQYVATLGSSGTLQLWVATWQGLLKVARDRSLRQLTPEECLRYLRLTPKTCPALDLKHNHEHH